MALTDKIRRNKWYKSGTILTTTGDSSSAWNGVEGVFPLAITVRGSFTGTVTIYASTEENPPSGADAEQGVLQTFSTPGVFTIAAPFEWIKAVTSGLTGSVTVSAEASESQAGM